VRPVGVCESAVACAAVAIYPRDAAISVSDHYVTVAPRLARVQLQRAYDLGKRHDDLPCLAFPADKEDTARKMAPRQ